MNAKERVENELKELGERIFKLTNFMQTENFNNLSDIQQTLLMAQSNAMHTYSAILMLRLKNWE